MLTEERLPPSANVSFPKYCSFHFKKIISKAVSPRRKDRFDQVIELRAALEKLSLGRAGKPAKAHLLEKIIIVGSQTHIGTTHIAVSLVSWLNRKQAAAYYQAREHSDVLSKLLAYQKGAQEAGGILSYQQFQAVTESNEAIGTTKGRIDHLTREKGIALGNVCVRAEGQLRILLKRPVYLESISVSETCLR